MKNLAAVLLLLILGISSAQVAIEGGNVTHANLNGTLASARWDGLFGEVVLGNATNYTYTVFGNNVTKLNIFAPTPNCTYSNLKMTIIAVNGSSLSLPLAAGNLSLLNSFVGVNENGSGTFTLNSTFQLNYGTFANVPTTYTYANNSTSVDFREGYFNDAAGHLVFVAVVTSNKPDWNGTTSDYQLMLPRSNGTENYTFFVSTNYTCATHGGGGGGGTDFHLLFVDPLGPYVVRTGETFNPLVTVENRGTYVETSITVKATHCPSGFSCGSSFINRIDQTNQNTSSLHFTAGTPGEYVITVCATNGATTACSDFIVTVLPACSSDSDCSSGEYCDAGVCKPKKPPQKPCERDGQCSSGNCAAGICVLCRDSSDCGDSEACSGGSCIPVVCPCGTIGNHECAPYECCADPECGMNDFCIANACKPKDLSVIVVEGQPIEDEPLRVRVTNNKGEPIPFAEIFTDYTSTTADQNGYGTIPTPYNGLLFGTADTYPQKGLVLDVIKKGTIKLEGQQNPIAGRAVQFRITDSHGLPIAGATVTVDGQTVITDGDGKFTIIFQSAGKKNLHAAKAGYLIDDTSVDVVEPTQAGYCGFPIFLNFFSFYFDTLYILWIFSMVCALISYFLLNRKIGWGWKKAAVYYFLPLVLALPNTCILTICFMSNVVLLQLIIAIILWLLKRDTLGLLAVGEDREERYIGRRAFTNGKKKK